MKKYVLTIALFVAFIATGFAQKMSAEDRAKKATDMMEKNLSLTEAQKTTIYAATLERVKATEALREAAGEGNKPDQEQMKAVNQKFAKVLKETLTDEQKAKMEEMKGQRDGNGPKKQNGGGNN